MFRTTRAAAAFAALAALALGLLVFRLSLIHKIRFRRQVEC